jgi:acyl-coenzyme A thioesterase PaaI-like protein
VHLEQFSHSSTATGKRKAGIVDDVNDLLQLMKTHRDSQPNTAPIWLAKRRLAAELRRISNTLCDSDANEDDILALAEIIGEKADFLQNPERPQQRGGPAVSIVPGMETFYDRGPIAGRSNPISPPASLEIDAEARRVVGEVEFGRAFEGAPGCVHGGFVAAVLDEALGMACIFGGGPAMTAELTTRFLRHTPIETPLKIEAKLEGVEGKKVRTSGRVTSEGVTVVDSTGLFIAVGSGKFEALLNAQRDEIG